MFCVYINYKIYVYSYFLYRINWIHLYEWKRRDKYNIFKFIETFIHHLIYTDKSLIYTCINFSRVDIIEMFHTLNINYNKKNIFLLFYKSLHQQLFTQNATKKVYRLLRVITLRDSPPPSLLLFPLPSPSSACTRKYNLNIVDTTSPRSC